MTVFVVWLSLLIITLCVSQEEEEDPRFTVCPELCGKLLGFPKNPDQQTKNDNCQNACIYDLWDSNVQPEEIEKQLKKIKF